MTNRNLTIGLVVVAIIAIIGLFTPAGKLAFGAIKDTSYFDYFNAATGGGFQINGTTVLSATTFVPPGTSSSVSGFDFGRCAILAYATTIAASSTATVDCSSTGRIGGTLTGITSGDNVMAMATTSISSTFLGVKILSAHASTTAGYITLDVSNETGTTFTWDGTASSTIAYQVYR